LTKNCLERFKKKIGFFLKLFSKVQIKKEPGSSLYGNPGKISLAEPKKNIQHIKALFDKIPLNFLGQ
jgi:hypothetical protein